MESTSTHEIKYIYNGNELYKYIMTINNHIANTSEG